MNDKLQLAGAITSTIGSAITIALPQPNNPIWYIILATNVTAALLNFQYFLIDNIKERGNKQ